MLRFFAALCTLLCSACVSINPIDSQYSGSNGGYVVLSISKAPDARFDRFGPTLTRIGTERTGAVDGVKLWTPPTGPYNVRRFGYFEDDGAGAVFVLRLAPGQYLLNNFTASRGVSRDATAWAANPEISLTFEVKTGRVAYIGSYRVRESIVPSITGGKVTQLHYEYRARLEQDLSVARREFPDLPAFTDDLSTKQTTGQIGPSPKLIGNTPVKPNPILNE